MDQFGPEHVVKVQGVRSLASNTIRGLTYCAFQTCAIMKTLWKY